MSTLTTFPAIEAGNWPRNSRMTLDATRIALGAEVVRERGDMVTFDLPSYTAALILAEIIDHRSGGKGFCGKPHWWPNGKVRLIADLTTLREKVRSTT